ncbi:MAG: heme biosynthesis operon protein HemX [Rhodocyclaceae bacterium]|nr:heme biosynthesis operon protein HemX [Rhodocyclaceae bacterium]
MARITTASPMTDTPNSPKESRPPEGAAPLPSPAPAHPTAPAFTPTLALLVALTALAGVVWLAIDGAGSQAKLRQQMVDYLARGDRANAEARQLADRADSVTRALDNRIENVEQRLTEWQNQQAAMEALYRNLARTRDEWVLGEIEQMLFTADQQLQLAGNIHSALNALQAADQILQRQQRPAMIPLRRALAADIDALRSRPQRDVVGSVARVDALIDSVDGWPLRHQFRLQAEAQTASPRPPTGLAALWADLRSLIRIQYSGDRDLAAVSPDGGVLLRENVRLRLTAARYAMIRGDEAQVSRELGLGAEWVQRYFNERDPSVRSALQQIGLLRPGTVAVEAPQIAASLEALRQARQAFERQG